MRSSKWYALGNSYLLVEEGELTAELARELVGDADGIVEVVRVSGDEAEIVIWNPDGSTAELSGNGTRIAARWLAERCGADAVRIRVGPRLVRARMLEGVDVEQELGDVDVGSPDEAGGVRFVPVSVGNPHAVVEGEPGDITRVGPLLERHPRFPERTNVEVVRIEAPGKLSVRVWERGVGETSASGTGAVAAAAATHGEGDVVARFPGGDLKVRLQAGRAWLTGPAERIE